MSDDVEKIILDELRILQGEVKNVGKEVARLQVKAGLTGLLGGLLPAVGVILWTILK